MTVAVSEVSELKGQLKQIWMAGDYDRFSRFLERGAREFYERVKVRPGCQLLDVACGSGQLALLAARDGVETTGVDIATNLLERAQTRAQAEGLNARFLEADAEDLPFEDGSFDVVTSLLGAMFAPRPELVAQEMLRVCAPGGTIAMANWTPDGFVGQMFKVFARFIAPSGMPAPVLWGNETVVRERLGHGIAGLITTRRTYPMSYPFPPADVVEHFRQNYGPTNRAFGSLDAKAAAQLRQDLVNLWVTNNRGGNGLTVLDAEYLEVIAIRA